MPDLVASGVGDGLAWSGWVSIPVALMLADVLVRAVVSGNGLLSLLVRFVSLQVR